MSLQHLANHVASKGRNGDSTLVHMTHGEVAGLQALAKRNGTSLTVNPHTGLPEAFSLKSLLPMAAGAALTPFVGPLGAAAIVGGLGYMTTGSLTQGLMAGMGAYGGAGLAGMAGLGAGAAGTQAVAGQVGEAAAAAPVTEGAVAATPLPALEGTTTATTPFQPSAATTANGSVYTGIPDATAMTPPPVNSGYVAPPPTNSGFVGPIQEPVVTTPSMGETFMKNASAQPMQAAQYGMAAASPVIAEEMAPKPYQAPEIKHDTDMGQRYAFESGYDNTIPGRTGPASYQAISNEEAKKLYGFAEGGDVQYPYGESVIRMADGGSTSSYVPSYSDVSYGMGPAAGLGSTPQGIAALSVPVAVNYDAATGYTPNELAAMNYVSAPKGNPNADIVALYAKVEADRKAAEAAADKAAADAAMSVFKKSYFGGATDSTADTTAMDPYAGYDYAAQGGLMQSYAQGGISTLGSYSDGGRLLKGPGDGMSDNIPAQIGAKQPARLADGEFVVPADVVSHLGNGSTDAGAKQLYKMMDKVRTARTGRKAQGKQINPNKYVPA